MEFYAFFKELAWDCSPEEGIMVTGAQMSRGSFLCVCTHMYIYIYIYVGFGNFAKHMCFPSFSSFLSSFSFQTYVFSQFL